MADTGGWTQHSDPKGRPYYHNASLNKTAWKKPVELLTPSQAATGWSLTSTSENRKYWFNRDEPTKTSWTAPDGWTEEEPVQEEDDSQLVSSSFYQPRDSYRSDSRQENQYDRNQSGYRGPAAVTATTVDFSKPEDAQAAFNKMLRRSGVQIDWTWDQTMRATILDPVFRAIKDASARKDAFTQYIENLKIEEKEKERDRVARFKVEFRNMLARHAEIKHYTRWKTAVSLLEHESSFTGNEAESEKKRIFADYIAELRQNHSDKRYQDHEEAMTELSGLLKQVIVSPETKWAEAQEKLQAHPTFANDEKYATLTKSEVLDAFVDQIRRMWDEVNTLKQREKHTRGRTARKAREAFKALLREMQNKDQIGPETQWQQIYPLLKDDDRYVALLDTCRPGEPRYDGSTPQDIFLDIIDDIDYEVDLLRKDVYKALRDMKFTTTTSTSESEFLAKCATTNLKAPQSQLKAVFKVLKLQAAEDEEDIARNKKRQTRKVIDLLRSRIKRLEPPVTLDDAWETVKSRIKDTSEYFDLETEEDRKAAFDKHVARLQDDAKERARERERRRSPPRSGDAYEADRRRAIEQRERLYRGDRRDSGDGRYDRERRERDAERERAYISRADPHAKTADLDYGDDGSEEEGPAKREREGSAGGRSQRKRVKTGDEDVAMHSGSEEGEMIEDGKK